MLIYLAGKPEDHEAIQKHANDLINFGRQLGIEVTIMSKWHINGELAEILASSRRIRANVTGESKGTEFGNLENDQSIEAAANQCRIGIENADFVIADMNGGGIEAGYAIAKGIPLIAVGDAQSPLAYEANPEVKTYSTWKQAIAYPIGPIGRRMHQQRLVEK
ncbi:MAG TPA: hypothetical protein VKR52_05085 [Terracidiphilus sp.]|nr:hypothetical protein [Terracidiphilus sp.]